MACSPFFICNNYYKKYIKDSYNLKKYFKCASRVPTGQGKVREICFFFKVREKSGNFKKWSVKFKNLKKSGKSQGILKLWYC